MRVRVLTDLAGPEVVYHAGTVYELDDETAQRLLEAGLAERAEEEPPARPRRHRAEENAAAGPTEERS